jgi:hypothetical protein
MFFLPSGTPLRGGEQRVDCLGAGLDLPSVAKFD